MIFHSKLLNHQRVDSSCLRVLDEGVCSKISNIANISPSGDADFFSGRPLPKLIILKSPICTCYIHASLRTQEIDFGSKKSEMNFLWCTHVRQQKNHFHGGEFTRTYTYVKPYEKNDPWFFEGVWFFTWLYKVGNKDFNLWTWKYNDYNAELA